MDRSVSGAAGTLKEYTVALEVFHKPTTYDPRQESTVRMHVARVRQKLAEYYQTEGVADPIVITLPKGGFKIHISTRREQAVSVLPNQTGIKRVSATKIWIFIAIGLVGALAASVAGIRLWPGNAKIFSQTEDLDKLWEPLLAPDRHLIICLSDAPAAPGYSAAGTADGAFLLGEFLATRKKDVVLQRSEQLSMANLGMDNMVFVGPVEGNRHLQILMANLGFVLEKNASAT